MVIVIERCFATFGRNYERRESALGVGLSVVSVGVGIGITLSTLFDMDPEVPLYNCLAIPKSLKRRTSL